MGNWNITIRGVGCHHNRRADVKDANKAAAEFVQRLKADGHTIVAASFTYGGEDDISAPEKYLADRAQVENPPSAPDSGTP
jgi:hypothetical protein